MRNVQLDAEKLQTPRLLRGPERVHVRPEFLAVFNGICYGHWCGTLHIELMYTNICCDDNMPTYIFLACALYKKHMIKIDRIFLLMDLLYILQRIWRKNIAEYGQH